MVVAALAHLLEPALHRLDVEVLGLLTPRFVAALAVLDDAALDPDLEWLRLAFEAARVSRDRDATQAILERFVRLTQATHDEHLSLWGAALLTRALADLGATPFDEDVLLAFRLVTDRIGWSTLTLGRLDIARERSDVVLGIVDQLVALDPYHERLRAHALRRLASCACHRTNFARAADLFDQAPALETATIGPDVGLAYRMTHVETLLALAEALDADGKRSSALAWAREALGGGSG